mmetsp:Transcript_42191/g.75551  ORF Transcript_42191/g.75551 Transcript_42191/m.75551 type:complete len:212 (+) Transcript_42191:58-693(+)
MNSRWTLLGSAICLLCPFATAISCSLRTEPSDATCSHGESADSCQDEDGEVCRAREQETDLSALLQTAKVFDPAVKGTGQAAPLDSEVSTELEKTPVDDRANATLNSSEGRFDDAGVRPALSSAWADPDLVHKILTVVFAQRHARHAAGVAKNATGNSTSFVESEEESGDSAFVFGVSLIFLVFTFLLWWAYVMDAGNEYGRACIPRIPSK